MKPTTTSEILKEMAKQYNIIASHTSLTKIKKSIERIATLTVQLRDAATDQAVADLITEFKRLENGN